MKPLILAILLAIFPCLLCPKQQRKTDEYQHVTDSLIQTGDSSKPSPSGTKSVVAPKQIESSQEENRSYGQKPQTDWYEHILAPVINNWPILLCSATIRSPW